MPRTAEQNRVIRDKRKAKITERGIEFFALFGPEEVVVDDITQSLGCSHGLFYHYFKNTEELYAYIPEHVADAPRLQPYRIPFAELEKLGAKETILRLADFIVQVLNGTDIAVFVLKVYAESERSLSTFVTPNGNSYYDGFIRLIERGQKDGVIIDGDPHEIALAFIDFLNGMIDRRILTKRKDYVAPRPEFIAHALLK